MAMVKLGNGIVDIRGGIGGIVFSKDRYCLHVHAKNRVVKRRSTLQRQRRNAYRTCVNYWNQSMSSDSRALWTNHARQHPTSNRFGNPIILTSFSAFMKLNIYRVYNGCSILSAPPIEQLKTSSKRRRLHTAKIKHTHTHHTHTKTHHTEKKNHRILKPKNKKNKSIFKTKNKKNKSIYTKKTNQFKHAKAHIFIKTHKNTNQLQSNHPPNNHPTPPTQPNQNNNTKNVKKPYKKRERRINPIKPHNKTTTHAHFSLLFLNEGQIYTIHRTNRTLNVSANTPAGQTFRGVVNLTPIFSTHRNKCEP